MQLRNFLSFMGSFMIGASLLTNDQDMLVAGGIFLCVGLALILVEKLKL